MFVLASRLGRRPKRLKEASDTGQKPHSTPNIAPYPQVTLANNNQAANAANNPANPVQLRNLSMEELQRLITSLNGNKQMNIVPGIFVNIAGDGKVGGDAMAAAAGMGVGMGGAGPVVVKAEAGASSTENSPAATAALQTQVLNVLAANANINSPPNTSSSSVDSSAPTTPGTPCINFAMGVSPVTVGGAVSNGNAAAITQSSNVTMNSNMLPVINPASTAAAIANNPVILNSTTVIPNTAANTNAGGMMSSGTVPLMNAILPNLATPPDVSNQGSSSATTTPPISNAPSPLNGLNGDSPFMAGSPMSMMSSMSPMSMMNSMMDANIAQSLMMMGDLFGNMGGSGMMDGISTPPMMMEDDDLPEPSLGCILQLLEEIKTPPSEDRRQLLTQLLKEVPEAHHETCIYTIPKVKAAEIKYQRRKLNNELVSIIIIASAISSYQNALFVPCDHLSCDHLMLSTQFTLPQAHSFMFTMASALALRVMLSFVIAHL